MTLYTYRIKEITKIYDGDTITVIIDLGFSCTIKVKIRLARINAPEIRGSERPEGLKSRDYLRERIKEAQDSKKNIYIKTYKDRKGKYGRYIGEIFIEDICINDELLEKGYAVEYK